MLHFAFKWTAGLLAAGTLAACSPLPAYEATSAELLEAERVTSSFSFSKSWAPQGREPRQALSGADEIRGNFWLASCVSELSARFVPAPGPAVRALQLGECMAARGWHLVVREVGGDQ